MATLLGPHLLDDLTGEFDSSTRERDQLLKWQPPVCLVLIPTVNRERLAPTGTEDEVTCLERLINETETTIEALKNHIEIDTTPPITTPIKFIKKHSELQTPSNQPPRDQLRATKVIGRIYLDDPRVEAQIMADPDLAAQFHHRLVLAARAKLNDIEAKLADRVNYWVVVNEVLGKNMNEMEKLGQYEKKRMELSEGAASVDTLYGCGLYALANANPDNLDLWDAKGNYGMATVLTKANDHNRDNPNVPQHVLLLHQYFQPDRSGVRSEGAGANKKLFLTDANLQNNVRRFEHHRLEDFQANYGNLKVIISEYGLDGRIGLDEDELHLSRGWKYFDEWSGTTTLQPGGTLQSGDGTPYLQALKALDRSNRGYKDVILGYCIYGWGYNCSYQFWSYPLDATPVQDSRCDPLPDDGKDPKDTPKRRDATMTQGLVTYAEALRTQTLPPQLRLNRDTSNGLGLPIYTGSGSNYSYRTIPDDDSLWYDIVGRSDSAATIRSEWWQIKVYAVGSKERFTTGWVNKDLVRFSSENNLTDVPVVPVSPSSASTPSVQSKANVVALVRKDPKDDAEFVQPLQDSAEALGLFGLSPRWYQVQLGNWQRGWVRASQVTGRNTNSLLTRKPRLRRWPGGSEAVPVRRGPGATDATVATLAAGNTDWRALLARDAAYAGWWQIRCDEVVGWVHKDYVQTHGSLGNLAVTWNRPQLSLLATTTDGLNVRSGPGTTHDRIASIAGGSTTRYDILGKNAATATWYQIRFSNEVTGWVSATYIQTHGDLTDLTVTWNRTAAVPQLSLLATTTDGLNVRSGPGTTHDRIASIAGGSTTRYDILGKDAATATWYQIRFSDEVTGWVEANDAVETEGNLIKAPPPQVGLADSVQTCVVRATPAAAGNREGTITDRSNRYVILGKNAATAAWYRIRFSDTVDGWVHKDHVQLYGELRNLPVVGTAPPASSNPQLSLRDTTTDGLNLRTGPGTGYRIVVTLPFATTRYNILGKDAATATWYQIQFSDGITGWVSATYIQTHGNLSGLTVTWDPTPQLSLLATTTDGLNVRLGPGTSHNIVASIAGGLTTRYNILGKDAAMPTWYQIRFSDSVTGWVHGDYVQTHGSLSGLTVTWNPTPQLSLLATTTINLNVRSGPGTSHGIVGSITGGSTTRYDILGKDAATATWYQIQFSSTVTGWVSATYVQTHGSLSGLTVTWNPTPQLSLLATTTINLNVRSGPGTSHGIVGSITGGSTTRYDILGKDAATATWYQIRFSSTVTGWVSATYVQTHGSLSGLTVTWNPTPQLSLLATTTINLNVRSGPGTSHGIVGSITGGSTTRYDILGKDAATATWYQIRFSATITGWVSATYVQTHGSLSGLTVTWNPPQLSLLATTTINLNVRSGPGTSHGVVGSITGGSTTRYDILGKDAATATWYQIRFSSTVTGWVSATYVQTHGSLSGLTVTWNPPRLSLLATTTAGLNVRSGPGGTHGIVGTITGGSTTRYDILGKDAATATWYQIRFSSTVTGWVSATYVQTHGSLSGLTVTWNPPRLSLLATTTAGLNVRSGPGGTHGIVGTIIGGSTTRYDILGKNAATATWYQIRFSSTVTGWVSATYVQTHGDLSGLTVTWTPPRLSLLATTTQNLNVRSGPGTSHSVVGTITGGSTTRYDILGKNAATATWYQIRFSSTVTGWVHKDYIQTHGSLSGLTVTWTPPRLSLLATTTQNLNVRSGPGTSHSVVGTITGGSTTRYDILGKNAATATWWQIRFSSTVTGWVFATYVQTHGDVSGVPVR